LFFGDDNQKHLTYRLDDVIPQALKDITATTEVDKTPWAASGWDDKQKAAGNEAYTTFINSQPKVEKRPIEGLDVMPDLQLNSEIKAEDCKEDPSWKKFWQAECQQFGWVRSEDPPSVTLTHGFDCLPARTNQYAFPDYFRATPRMRRSIRSH
jgi:hypothetical protein